MENFAGTLFCFLFEILFFIFIFSVGLSLLSLNAFEFTALALSTHIQKLIRVSIETTVISCLYELCYLLIYSPTAGHALRDKQLVKKSLKSCRSLAHILAHLHMYTYYFLQI